MSTQIENPPGANATDQTRRAVAFSLDLWPSAAPMAPFMAQWSGSSGRMALMLLGRAIELRLEHEGLLAEKGGCLGTICKGVGLFTVHRTGPAAAIVIEELTQAHVIHVAEVVWSHVAEGAWIFAHRPADRPLLPFNRWLSEEFIQAEFAARKAELEEAARYPEMLQRFKEWLKTHGGGTEPTANT